MQFSGDFYHYQKEILKTFEKELDIEQKKIHVVAPPGSGKTIVGIEMLNRLFLKQAGVCLILVPNTVLQTQWRDKIEQFFLEENEDTFSLISLDIGDIKKVNIITYQAITQGKKDSDFIEKQVYSLWKQSEGRGIKDFGSYIEELKFDDLEKYSDKFKFYQKKLKKSSDVSKLLSRKVQEYFFELKKLGVSSIVLDEAHHLTSWWSKVIFNLYRFLSTQTRTDMNSGEFVFGLMFKGTIEKRASPYIVGLTATPPFDDVDYFTLDKNYISLLGEVDYYIPTPAIVKSAKLSPYNDLVQFVELPKNYQELILEKKSKLDALILENKESLVNFYFDYLLTYDKNINNDKRIESILKFCNIYLEITSHKFELENFTDLEFEDIIYAISFWVRKEKKEVFNVFKTVLYDIGYVWKKSRFVKFFAYIDKLEIYNPEKINAVKNILHQEQNNLSISLRAVIITDFFDDVDGLLDCKKILKELVDFTQLNPILVSGQGMYQISEYGDFIEVEKDILTITKEFNAGEYKLLIGTRGFLGEGWDSPQVNTLIDLTGVSSFMSTNQVRGRAIRLDKSNLKKVSNIYDIITVDSQDILHKDINRLKKKHNQTYGVSDSGLVIKGIEHIYPNLLNNIKNIEEFNKKMLIRSTQRDYFYKLWKVGGKFENKEQFIMQLHVNPLFKYFPLQMNIFGRIYTYFFKLRDIKLKKIGEITYYDRIMKNYISRLLSVSENCLKANGVLSSNFSHKILIEGAGSYKIIGKNKIDEFEIKKFIEISSKIFSPVLDQRYIFFDTMKILENKKFIQNQYFFPLPKQLSNNQNQRRKWHYYFKSNSKFKKNFRYPKTYEYNIYKKFKYIENNKTHYLGYTSFIHSEIEKIWI